MSKKGARKTGGGGASKRAKDTAMAGRMRGVERTTMRCPICHKPVANGAVPHSGCGSKKG